MVSAPWYLLAAGIALVVVGFLLAALTGERDDGRRIHRRMRDEDVARELKRQQRLPVASLVILAGMLCVLVSVCWRLARAFL